MRMGLTEEPMRWIGYLPPDRGDPYPRRSAVKSVSTPAVALWPCGHRRAVAVGQPRTAGGCLYLDSVVYCT
jgi:hypothetical protein